MKKLTVILCILLFGCANVEVKNAARHEQLPSHPELQVEELQEEESGVCEMTSTAPVKEIGRRYVYLTFDDGPSLNTNRIMNVLSDFQVKGTFFFVGDRILEFDRDVVTTIMQRVLSQGHYIGLHSMTHDQHHLYWNPSAHRNFLNEMRQLQDLIHEITGHFTNLYRAPYGSLGTFNREHIRTMIDSGFKGWDWNIDTMDWSITSAAQILEKVKTDMEASDYPNNVVILFHERNVTVQALPSIIRYFQELDYTFLPYHPNNHFPMNLMGHSDL
ncbi:MAG: polysaccharide deacetylase [Treponema sp.]|jgi:peptidoglycan/xylan/chitin deacetylase (PgdA/CDA1 family)|nr:polysaccharide deacetylase [Treponema sp.]